MLDIFRFRKHSGKKPAEKDRFLFDLSIINSDVPPGIDFSLESMEEELTCPVCLELYADPLMLPCSHSVCKKCLQDILDNRTKKRKSKKDLVLDCPSCRKEVHLNKERLAGLPRNLALENIVIRYADERSKSIRKSLVLDSPTATALLSPLSTSADLFPPCPSDCSTLCGLCDSSASANKAVWNCVQCEVSYCQSCFTKYHPRRGALARHKLRQPLDSDAAVDKPRNCTEHDQELASLFCDRCKVLVCHLCVCEGDGLHAGHTVFTPQTACKKIKDSLDCTKDESDCLLATMLEQRGKIDALLMELQDNHKEAVSVIETQYDRLLADVTHVFTLHKSNAIKSLDDTKDVFQTTTTKYLNSNSAKVSELEELSRRCHRRSMEEKTTKLLEKSRDATPITQQLKQHQKQVKEIAKLYEDIVEDKTARTSIACTATAFGDELIDTLSAMFDKSACSEQLHVPLIISPLPPSRSSDVTPPRISNKCLSTWGFTSTTFTAERQTASSSWSVTVERNIGHGGHLNSGYMFGMGVAKSVLNVKDLVGMNESSFGLICNGGMLQCSHDGNVDNITPLEALPLTITLTLHTGHAHYNLLTYRVQSCSGKRDVGSTLITKKLLHQASSKEFSYPVFSVSQKVKLLFPTCV